MRYILLLLAFTTNLFALSEKEILALADKPHSPKNLSEEMKIFPQQRKYKCVMIFSHPKEIGTTDPIISHSKIVEGKFDVCHFDVPTPDGDVRFHQVTYFIKNENVYVRHTFCKKFNLNLEFRGVRLGEEKHIAWTMLSPEKHGVDASFFSETYTNNSIAWELREYRNGKLTSAQTGKATAIDE